MTNTQRFAELELNLLSQSATDLNNRPIIEPFKKEILALCEAFGTSGQSGGSAPYTATALSQAIKKLLLQEPILPMTGFDDEWMDVSNWGDGKSGIVYQNKRCSGLFKDSNGKCWYLDAIAWKTENGGSWSGSALLSNGKGFDKYYSRNFVKSFPFTPKTFYIDVTEVEEPKHDWTFYVKNEKQLQKVFKYYDRYE